MAESRNIFGACSVGSVVAAITRPVFRGRSSAVGQLLSDWISIMGPAIGAITAPHKFAAGTLTIACSGPIAMELQHLEPELISRINTHLGRQMVLRLRFMQRTVPVRAPPIITPPVSPAAAVAADAAVAAIPVGDLRAALVSLGQAVLSADRRR